MAGVVESLINGKFRAHVQRRGEDGFNKHIVGPRRGDKLSAEKDLEALRVAAEKASPDKVQVNNLCMEENVSSSDNPPERGSAPNGSAPSGSAHDGSAPSGPLRTALQRDSLQYRAVAKPKNKTQPTSSQERAPPNVKRAFSPPERGSAPNGSAPSGSAPDGAAPRARCKKAIETEPFHRGVRPNNPAKRNPERVPRASDITMFQSGP